MNKYAIQAIPLTTIRRTHLRTQATAFAVLDVQWSPHASQTGPILAVAASTGLVAIYTLTASNGTNGLMFVCQHAITDPAILVLSIAWHPSDSSILGFTLSDGTVGTAKPRAGSDWTNDTAVEITEIHRHELEAWTLAFDRGDGIQVISGGDDSVLQCSCLDDTGGVLPVWKNRKLHEAGVTAILPLTTDLMLTGSYDDHVRLISHQPNGRPRCLLECNLGGGVWRLKLLHEDYNDASGFTILASCMHAGTRVIRLRGDSSEDAGWTFGIIGKFEEHRSMNYGSDAQPGNGSLETIVSTSFYDKLLCLWHIDT